MDYRRLGLADLDGFFACRLRALQNAPAAFLTTYDEDKAKGPARFAATLGGSGAEGAIYGAVDAEQVVGILGLHRGDRAKTAHKVSLTSMYVDAPYRGRGVAGKLVDLAVAHARDEMGAVAVYLSLEAENTAALRLYESRGFLIWGREPKAMGANGMYRDELHMALMVRS